jgi:putative DNA primase/helicase
MQDIFSDMSSNGLMPDSMELDGKIHRFKDGRDDHKKSGYYLGFQNHTEAGHVFQVVVYGTYRTGEQFKYQSNVQLSKHDRASMKDNIRKAQRAADHAREIAHEETAKEVQEKWEKLSTDGDSEYLRKKQIVECPDLGVRYDNFTGDIYVPAKDGEGKIWTLQKIQRDGAKFFHDGGRALGSYHVLGDIGRNETCYIVEGLATAGTIRLATGCAVVVAFNAGGLPKVCQSLKVQFPETQFVVCGDDDVWKEKNAGRTKAEEGAKLALAACCFPTFKNVESKPTDWNDLHCLEGLQEVKAQLDGIKTEKASVTALGFKESTYFFTSSSNKQLVGISKFTEDAFLNLMPFNYWESLYPGQGQSRVDWSHAKSELMSKCRKVGIFESNLVRGSGVWSDDGRVVVNMGDHLLVDLSRVEFSDFHSRFFYTLSKKIPDIHSRPLSSVECETLTDACDGFVWQKPDSGHLLAGALVLARVCGALPVRPHMWLSGEFGSGKSTLFTRLIDPILGSPTVLVHGNTTEAGIRQRLVADAIPVVFDEFETTDQKTSERVQSIIDLMRVAWSDSNAAILKGSSGGIASSFQVKFSAIVSSIRTNLKMDADISRFTVIELAPHGNNPEQWAKLSTVLDQIDVEYGNRLFARTIRMLPVLTANYKLLKRAFSANVSQRFGDQYGMLLAGCTVLLQDDPITEDQAFFLVNQVKLTDEREQAKIADQVDALDHLLTKKIQIDVGGNKRDIALSVALDMARTHSEVDEALQRIGIRVEFGTVSIASKHNELESTIYRGSRWSHQWSNSLSRLPGAVRNKTTRIGGRAMKCTLLTWESLGIF